MKTFDLKKFRGSTGLNQEQFANRIKRSQTTVSRIEKGEKVISDKFLDAVSKGFSIDLEVYKSYNQPVGVEYNDAMGIHTQTLSHTYFSENNKLATKHDITDLELRYRALLREREKIESEHHALYTKLYSLEPAIMLENNELLKKLTTQNELILMLLHEIEKK